MTTYLNDLEPLDDILDILVFEDEPTIFDDAHAIELVETALHLMEEYMDEHPTAIADPHFHEILLEEIKEMFYVQMEDHILDNEYIEDDMNDLLEYAFQIYITTFHPERSLKMQEDEEDIKEDVDDDTKSMIEQKIQRLRDIPQPVQRTREWYEFRWNLITASNAWKAFESQSAINQLVYEKCQPIKTASVDDDIKMVNINTTLHWGQKYEPLSVMLYEHLYNSTVEDFGCIQHSVYKFIGASPDGIFVKSDTGRYGRMLEIKNIVNREINGIPKKEYWIQMQLQMEVCDLDECDFLETKFIEYPDFQSFKDDSTIGMVDNVEFSSYTTSKSGDFKGIIIHFQAHEGNPHYEYMPLHLWKPQDVQSWEDSIIQKYESEPYRYTFIKFIYWKLEKMSCVMVARNKEWFKNNVGQLEKVWAIIEQERVTGYEHRAPVKKPRKEQLSNKIATKEEICFLKVVKLE